jgi:uncharacterized integral membrane protein
MRALYITVLVLIVAALAIFAYQNDESVTLRYFRRSITLPISLLIAAVYVLGMVSGWTVVGFLRRSWRGALERPQK